jgi:hypothetical protein
MRISGRMQWQSGAPVFVRYGQADRLRRAGTPSSCPSAPARRSSARHWDGIAERSRRWAAVRDWASGYFLKSSRAPELLDAIQRVLKGNRYLSPQFADRQTQEFIRDPRLDRENQLTVRQREVLQLLSEGYTMKEAAARLCVCMRTVAFHKYEIMNSLVNYISAYSVVFRQPSSVV